MSHTLNPSNLGCRGRWISRVEVSLVYTAKSAANLDYMRSPSHPKKQTNKKTGKSMTFTQNPEIVFRMFHSVA